MRIKSNDNGLTIYFGSLSLHQVNDLSVTIVQAIKCADGNYGIPKSR